MAELVDAPSSGGGARKGVEVRVLFWAPFVLLLFSQIIYKTRRNPRDLTLGSFRIVPPVLGGSRHFCGPLRKPHWEKARTCLCPRRGFAPSRHKTSLTRSLTSAASISRARLLAASSGASGTGSARSRRSLQSEAIPRSVSSKRETLPTRRVRLLPLGATRPLRSGS